MPEPPLGLFGTTGGMNSGRYDYVEENNIHEHGSP